ncbi:hypothetical protein AB1N83_005640, partial [Pleurotus pulmonarius]
LSRIQPGYVLLWASSLS